MRIVRCPSARCSRTRRSPAGNPLVRISSVSSSWRVGLDLRRRGVLVAPVEVAQEVAAVDAVQLQQPRRLRQRAQRVAQPLAAVEAAGRQPRVALDDVAGDQRVLEVERGDVAGRVEHLAAQAGGAVGRRLARRRLDPGVLDDRRQVDLADVRRPVDGRGIEGERRLVGGVEPVPHRQQVVDLVDRLALGVEAVQLDVLERPLDLHPLGLELGRQVGLLAPQRQRLQHLLAPGDHGLGPGRAAPARGRGRGSGTRGRRSAGPRCRRAGAR